MAKPPGQTYRIVGLTNVVEFLIYSDHSGYQWNMGPNSLSSYNSAHPADSWTHYAGAFDSGTSFLHVLNG